MCNFRSFKTTALSLELQISFKNKLVRGTKTCGQTSLGASSTYTRPKISFKVLSVRICKRIKVRPCFLWIAGQHGTKQRTKAPLKTRINYLHQFDSQSCLVWADIHLNANQCDFSRRYNSDCFLIKPKCNWLF